MKDEGMHEVPLLQMLCWRRGLSHGPNVYINGYSR
jgi:hypothetical protein